MLIGLVRLLGHLGEYGFHEHELRDKKLSQSSMCALHTLTGNEVTECS